MKKKMVLKKEIKERIKQDLLDLGFLSVLALFIYIFILFF